ncbi:transporter [Halosolutus gelatinilyticus]|nr:transporter [Halosolutus gelatinilyticus]
MVRLSTIVILIGIGLLLVPIPPVATILGALVILGGLALRIFRDT